MARRATDRSGYLDTVEVRDSSSLAPPAIPQTHTRLYRALDITARRILLMRVE